MSKSEKFMITIVTGAKLQGDRYLVTVAKFAGWNRVGKLGKPAADRSVS